MKKSKDVIIRNLKRELLRLQRDQLILLNVLDKLKKGKGDVVSKATVNTIIGGGV